MVHFTGFVCLNKSSILFPPFPLRSSSSFLAILPINPWLVWDRIRVLPHESTGALRSRNFNTTQVLFKIRIVSWNEERFCVQKIHLAGQGFEPRTSRTAASALNCSTTALLCIHSLWHWFFRHYIYIYKYVGYIFCLMRSLLHLLPSCWSSLLIGVPMCSSKSEDDQYSTSTHKCSSKSEAWCVLLWFMTLELNSREIKICKMWKFLSWPGFKLWTLGFA